MIISPVQPAELMRRIKSRQRAPERSPLWSLLWWLEFQWPPQFTEACDHKRIPLGSWVGRLTGEDEQEECELEASLGSIVTSWREGRRERGEETEAETVVPRVAAFGSGDSFQQQPSVDAVQLSQGGCDVLRVAELLRSHSGCPPPGRSTKLIG